MRLRTYSTAYEHDPRQSWRLKMTSLQKIQVEMRQRCFSTLKLVYNCHLNLQIWSQWGEAAFSINSTDNYTEIKYIWNPKFVVAAKFVNLILF